MVISTVASTKEPIVVSILRTIATMPWIKIQRLNIDMPHKFTRLDLFSF